ncbi:ATP-binding protein [Laspinema sp. D1]|uniref:histidine kinase n=1 Tax=Laspinema palackyanum D2a TaxID=2953684 RepID=A0ABT2MUB5_9CYAN|nr:ATP-binding protein [Laspinema sp. D2b]MCT7967486.1 ATP-binding protein [Laspinema sp. D2a]
MSNETILVVEDEGIVALDIQTILEDLGYQVPVAVASGEEAIQSVAEIQPDLVLMDIHLEGSIDGVSAAEQIRDRFNIPVVYLTAYSDEDTLQRAKLTTPFGYLIKPLEARSLKSTIDMAIYRHQIEQELKQSKEWFATTLRSIGDAVIATDEIGRIRFINPVAETLTGWKQAEALGKEIGQVFRITHEMSAAIAQRLGTAEIPTENLGETPNERVLIAKNGSKIPIDDTVAPIGGENDKIIGAVYVFRDITSKKATEVLQKERIRLETEVKERALAEAEIRRLLEIETELSEFKSRLITTISHEFRTPMSVILSSAELLQVYSDTWPEERKETHYQRIKTAIEYMTGMIEDVTLVGQAESGHLEFQPHPMELVDFCTRSVEQMNVTTGDRHHIRLIAHTEKISALMDSQLLRQILNNLFSNAIKYSPQGGEITLELNTESRPITPNLQQPESLVVFRIKDPGIGIPQQDLQQLFESFQRATNVGTIRGTGLGLAIVKKCVELHRGHIEIESEIDRGSTFIVKIPLQTPSYDVMLAEI